MQMRLYLICIIWFLIGGSHGKNTHPHVVFILADDLGYNDIGYHAKVHESGIKTPYLDMLASNGIKLENYYVQKICTPTRSQLLSGRYQIHTGLQHGVFHAEQRAGLSLDNILLPEQLRSCGYDTHMIGKWHLGHYKKEFMPQYRGFNSYYGYLNGAEDYFTHSLCRGRSACGVDMRNTGGPFNTTWGQYSAHTFSERAKSVIDMRDKSKPFFLYLALQSVHEPVQVPEIYEKQFMYIKDKTRRTYAGMVAAMDEAVMNVTEHLKRSGMYDDTIIIFSTDNGGQNQYGGNNWPLRGRKATLWEGGVKGVGFVTGGGLGMTNATGANFMHVSDWFPTLLTATGCPKIPGTQPLDGFDQWRAILQKEPSRRTELLHNIDPLRGKSSKPNFVHGFDITKESALRSGPWKLMTGSPGFSDWVKPPESQNHVSLNTPYIPWSSKWIDPDVADNYDDLQGDDNSHDHLRLFNIENDPYERNEVSSKYPDIVKKLLHRLVEYNETAVPPIYPPTNDKRADPRYHGGYWGPWVESEEHHVYENIL